MAHDLARYLADVAARLERFPKDVSISWASPGQLKDYFGCECWAGCHVKARCIVISDDVKRAPRYVVRHLVLHEALHMVVPSRGACEHPRAFRIAEQASPDHLRAWAWLDAHAFPLDAGQRLR